MSQRPKCTYKDCNNPVMTGPLTRMRLSVCQECFDRGRSWNKKKPKEEGDGEITLYESSLGYL